MNRNVLTYLQVNTDCTTISNVYTYSPQNKDMNDRYIKTDSRP